VGLEVSGQLKNQMTSSGNELVTFRLVAWCLNFYAIANCHHNKIEIIFFQEVIFTVMYTLILIILIIDGHPFLFDISRPTVSAVKSHQWDISHRLKNTGVGCEDSLDNDIIKLHWLRRTSKIDVTGG
jgi:hypothetical protein